jgi:hypothetical protein
MILSFLAGCAGMLMINLMLSAALMVDYEELAIEED